MKIKNLQDLEIFVATAEEGGAPTARPGQLAVMKDIDAGSLKQVCADWEGENVPLYLLVADRRQIPAAVRRLHDYLAARCDQGQQEWKCR